MQAIDPLEHGKSDKPPCASGTHLHRQIGAPVGLEDEVSSCPAAVCQAAVHVAWQLDPGELEKLANGGMLWLTTMGGLPPHYLTVTDAQGR